MATRRKQNIVTNIDSKEASIPKFSVEKLGTNCRQLFGVSTSTFTGATCGMTGKYTVEEMREHIEDWKKKGVK